MEHTPGRLLIVVRGGENYGVATKLLNLAGAFRARGWAVTVYALGLGEFVDRARAIDGVAFEIDPAVPARFVAGRGKLGAYVRLLRGSAAFVRRLRGYMKRTRHDAMIFCEHGLVLPIALAGAGTATPMFWLMPNTVSGDYPADINRRLYAAAFGASGMIPVANSSHTRTTLGRAAGLAAQIDLGVDPAPFLAPPAADPLAGIVPAGAVRLTIMARLTPSKGQLQLLEAILATPEADAVHLIVCGGPAGSEYEQALREAAAAAPHRLHLIGPVERPAPYLSASDIVANPRLDAEPFGLSVVEAMFAGKPVLAHALGGPADIVVDGATGWLLMDMQPATIAAGLKRMIDDRARWASMGTAGRARAQARYTVETMADQLLAVLADHGVAKAQGSVHRD